MSTILHEWGSYLTDENGLLGALLVTGGATLLFAGWRIDRVALLVIFGLAGFAVGAGLSDGQGQPIWGGCVGAGAAAVVCAILRSYAPTLLAGVVGGFAALFLLEPTTMPPVTVYLLTAVAFAVGAAFCITFQRESVIVMTALAGSALMVSGLVAMVHESRWLGRQFEAMASTGILYPFLILVPTVSGVLLQLGAAKRRDMGEPHS